MVNCLFNTEYFDYEKNKASKYECEDNAIQNGFCKFHQKNYLGKDLYSSFKDKAEKASKNNEPFFCIGFNIPEIKLNCNFSKPVYFKKAIIKELDCHQTKFKEVDFSESFILGTANFESTNFFSVDFIKAKFFGPSNFKKVKVSRGANFFGTEFHEFVDFSESDLAAPSFIGSKIKEIDFSLAKVESGNFSKAVILQDSNFLGAELAKTNFSKSLFKGSSDFSNTNISKSNFSHTLFENANFSNSKLDVVSFNGANFKGPISFDKTEFHKVDFAKSVFHEEVNFGKANFNDIDFTETEFSHTANFFQGNFKQNIKFKKTNFHDVIFDEANFIGKADFDSVKFLGKTNFNKTKFRLTDFTNSEFANELNFSGSEFNDKTKFHKVLFKKPARVIFDVEDLSKVSLIDTDFSRIRFSERVKWGGKDGFKLTDEYSLTKSTPYERIESVLAAYRNLRTNFEKRLRFEDADKIFAREDELKKKYSLVDKNIVNEKRLLMRKIDTLTKNNNELKREISSLKKRMKK